MPSYRYSIGQLLAEGQSAASLRVGRFDCQPGRLIPANREEHEAFASLPLSPETTAPPSAEDRAETLREARNAVRRQRYAARRAA